MTHRLLTHDSADVRRLRERLATLPLFAGASTDDLAEIARSGVAVTVPQGWSLIWERTPADKAYVVLSGEVDIRRADAHVVRLAAGDVVGETAILQRRLRNATVVAATRLEVLHFTADAVERLYGGVPAFRVALDAAAPRHAS